jgi:apolipoprotein N-acyltransferase
MTSTLFVRSRFHRTFSWKTIESNQVSPLLQMNFLLGLFLHTCIIFFVNKYTKKKSDKPLVFYFILVSKLFKQQKELKVKAILKGEVPSTCLFHKKKTL